MKKQKNIIIIRNLKENILMVKNGMEKHLILW